MRFSCDKEELIAKLAFVTAFIDQGSLNQIHGLLYIAAENDSIELRAMNGMVYASILIPAVTDEERFEALVVPSIFNVIVQSLEKGDINFERIKNRLVVSQGDRERTIGLAKSDDFLDFPKVSQDVQITVQLSAFLGALGYVGFAKSDTRDRPVLQGICLTENYVLAGDGMRLAGLRMSIPNAEQTIMVPNVVDVLKGLARLGVADELQITYGGIGWMQLETDICTIWIAQLAGEYPTTATALLEDRLNNTECTAVLFNRREMYSTLVPVEVYAKTAESGRQSREMRMSILQDGIRCEIDTSEGGLDDTVLVEEVRGNDVWILMHSGLLLEALRAAPRDEVLIKVWAEYQPLLITCPGTNWAVLQTPMATKEIAEKWEAEREGGDDF